MEAIVQAWRELPPAERKQSLALMSLELQRGSTGQQRDVELWSLAVHEALEAALGASDGAAYGPQVVRRVLAAPAFWSPVEDFMQTSKMMELTPPERLAAYRTLARLVVARAKKTGQFAGIPLTPKLVGSCASGIAGLFDNAFPGYVRSGMAKWVVLANGQQPEGA